MKKLKYIHHTLTIFQILITTALLFGGVAIFQMDGHLINVINPHLEFRGQFNEVEQDLNQYLDSVIIDKAEIRDDYQLKLSRIELAKPATTSWKIGIFIYIILKLGLVYIIIELIKKIVDSIRKDNAFTRKSVQRVKNLGIAIIIGTIGEWMISKIVVAITRGSVMVEGMTLESDSTFSWTAFTLSLLIFTIGYAFEQGIKLREENELTV